MWILPSLSGPLLSLALFSRTSEPLHPILASASHIPTSQRFISSHISYRISRLRVPSHNSCLHFGQQHQHTTKIHLRRISHPSESWSGPTITVSLATPAASRIPTRRNPLRAPPPPPGLPLDNYAFVTRGASPPFFGIQSDEDEMD